VEGDMSLFQHQQPMLNFGFTKPAATQKHGQSAAKDPIPVRESRTFQPRPGH
jgi:hypothetical protein